MVMLMDILWEDGIMPSKTGGNSIIREVAALAKVMTLAGVYIDISQGIRKLRVAFILTAMLAFSLFPVVLLPLFPHAIGGLSFWYT